MKKEENKKSKEKEEISINLTELKIQENFSKIIDNISQVLELLKQRLLLHDAPIAKSAIFGFLAMVFAILACTFVLVFLNKLDSFSFALIIGTILGYFLSTAKMFIRREGE